MSLMWPATHSQKKIDFQTFRTFAINNSCLQRYLCLCVNTCWGNPKKSTKYFFTICQQAKLGEMHYFFWLFRSVLLTTEWFSKSTNVLTCYQKPTDSRSARSTDISDNSAPKIYLKDSPPLNQPSQRHIFPSKSSVLPSACPAAVWLCSSARAHGSCSTHNLALA